MPFSADLREVWKRLSLQDGDVVFVDANAVDVSTFARNRNDMMHERLPHVTIIPVLVPAGKSINDCLVHLTREQVGSVMQGCKL